MPEEILSTELITRWRGGDQETAVELFGRYQNKLLQLVASKLNTRMKQQLEPPALVQSIFGSVIRTLQNKPIEFTNDDGLWKWLSTVALNKTYNKIDKLRSIKGGGEVIEHWRQFVEMQEG